MSTSVYPNSFFSWGSDREDEDDIVHAADPNSLAAEVAAIQATLGINPQIEKSPLDGGSPVTYPDVDTRISHQQQGHHLPYVSLGANNLEVRPGDVYGIGQWWGAWNIYTVQEDPFSMYNGRDVTIPQTGWWIVTMGQFWPWHDVGYGGIWFWIDNIWTRHHHWFWDFRQNFYRGPWRGYIGYNRDAHTNITWQGHLNAGQRIRVLSENGTPLDPYSPYTLDFRAVMVRSIP